MQERKLKEPKFVRWLLHDAAVTAFLKSLPAVITALEREATERKDPAAKAYVNRVKTFKFVACLLLLADVLPHLAHLSRKFQESNLDYSQLSPALDATVLCIQQMFTHFGTQERKLCDYLERVEIQYSDVQKERFNENIRLPYLRALIDKLQRRFPAMPLLNAFGIFNPSRIQEQNNDDQSDNLADFGTEELGILLEALGEKVIDNETVPALVRVDSIITEWIRLKALVCTVPSLKACKSVQSLAIALHKKYASDLPNILTMIDWGLAIILSTADSERDFSRLELIKSARRNRLRNSTINCLMEISIDGPPLQDFPFQRALLKWHSMSTYRRLPSAAKCLNQTERQVTTSSVSVPVQFAATTTLSQTYTSASEEEERNNSTLSMLPSEKSHGLEVGDSAIPQCAIVGSPAPARRKCSGAVATPAAKRRNITNYFSLAAKQGQSEVSAPMSNSPDIVTSNSLAMDFRTRTCVTLLPREKCQGLINGRNGSSACTVLCAIFSKKVLSQSDITHTFASPSNQDSLMCDCMVQGNEYYDQLGLERYFSCDEVANLQPAIGISITEEVFITPDHLHEVVSRLQVRAGSNTSGALAAGVLIIQPYSFAVAVIESSFILFDSHAHGLRGALLAVVPCSDGTAYLKQFFQKYYQSSLKFAGSVPGKIAQLSLLQLC